MAFPRKHKTAGRPRILRNPVRHWKQLSSFRIGREIAGDFGGRRKGFQPACLQKTAWKPVLRTCAKTIFVRWTSSPSKTRDGLEVHRTNRDVVFVCVLSTHAQVKWHNRRIHKQGSDVPGRRKPGERSGVSPPSQMSATRWADTNRSPSYAPRLAHGCLYPSIDPNGHAVDHVCANVTAA